MAPLNQSSEYAAQSLSRTTPDFRIVELGNVDARKITDNLKVLKELISSSESMYPNIARWFDEKVVPGLRSSERVAYIGYVGTTPVASAVLKVGENAKFCHLRIHRDFQDHDIGQMFFTQMTLEARHRAKEIHFTLPEGLWSEKHHFFESFGFSSPVKAPRQYRHGEAELACSAPLRTVWMAAQSRLPKLMGKFSVGGYSLDKSILLSIKPKYAEQILSGIKLVEIRRRFSDRWIGSRVVIYASRPLSALLGEATITNVTNASPIDVWNRFGKNLGCSLEELLAYSGSLNQISAVELGHVIPYRAPVTLSQLSYLVDADLRPPQSYCDLRIDSGNAWTRAAWIASLLHGRVNTAIQGINP